MHARAVVAYGLLTTVAALAQFPVLAVVNGDSTGDNLGQAVSGAGDVNGDGVPDYIVGMPNDDNNGANSGSARVYSGLDGSVLFTFDGDSPDDAFGTSVGGAGDVDHDGFADLIVGAPRDDVTGLDSGTARILSGATGLPLFSFFGTSASAQLGMAVARAGDVNADGYDDVIVGSPLETGAALLSGTARVYSGLTGLVLHTLNGTGVQDFFGMSVSGAGDVNGDGFDDVIVGASQLAMGSTAGYARVYSGLNGTVLLTFNGAAPQDRFGGSVSGAGDVNGDGLADVIVGASQAAAAFGGGAGYAKVFSGSGGALLFTFTGAAPGDGLGVSVGGAGDVNGDGFADVIVGAAQFSFGINPGYVRVFSGADGSILRHLAGDSPADAFGSSVGGAGDVNGDGFADLIAGAPRDDNTGSNSGSAKVFSLCGARRYGIGIVPSQTLALSWSQGPPGFVPFGAITTTGAGPNASGIGAISLSNMSSVMAGGELLVDLVPGASLIVTFGYDAAGAVSFPVGIQAPTLAGISIFFQSAELGPAGIHTSNGLHVVVCP